MRYLYFSLVVFLSIGCNNDHEDVNINVPINPIEERNKLVSDSLFAIYGDKISTQGLEQLSFLIFDENKTHLYSKKAKDLWIGVFDSQTNKVLEKLLPIASNGFISDPFYRLIKTERHSYKIGGDLIYQFVCLEKSDSDEIQFKFIRSLIRYDSKTNSLVFVNENFELGEGNDIFEALEWKDGYLFKGNGDFVFEWEFHGYLR